MLRPWNYFLSHWIQIRQWSKLFWTWWLWNFSLNHYYQVVLLNQMFGLRVQIFYFSTSVFSSGSSQFAFLTSWLIMLLNWPLFKNHSLKQFLFTSVNDWFRIIYIVQLGQGDVRIDFFQILNILKEKWLGLERCYWSRWHLPFMWWTLVQSTTLHVFTLITLMTDHWAPEIVSK